MKKLLVGAAAISLGLACAAPAHAQLQLGVAGHFKGYVDWDSQDTNTGWDPATPGHGFSHNLTGGATANQAAVRRFDIVRDTEVHFTGETTLDNGLTVGVHVEAEADDGDGFGVDESYAYFSGAWGRTNFGDEDGAAYLLQVAAPSADSNVDGIRQYVNPVNFAATAMGTGNASSVLGGAATTVVGLSHLHGTAGELDYANDATRHEDKLTYLTPVFSGFQAGVSYTPNDGVVGSRSFGNSLKDGANSNLAAQTLGSAWEGAARWEGTFNNFGINLGGGYTWVNLEDRAGPFPPASVISPDNFKQWNLGADVNYSAFGLGVVYTRNNQAQSDGNERTWVVGGDYTTGPFKLGVSWLNDKMDDQSQFRSGPAGNNHPVSFDDVKINRYSGGVVYTFAPGMSFRGSVGLMRGDTGSGNLVAAGTRNAQQTAVDVNAIYGLLGTQINF